MSKSGRFTLGLVMGALAGSIVSLLYAPEKGQTTRNRLSYRFTHYIDELNSMIDQLRKEREKLVSEAKERGDQVVTDAKERAEDLIKEAEALLANASGAAGSVKRPPVAGKGAKQA